MTTPTFNPNIPQSTNTIADGQSAFLTNFSQLFSIFGTNHISLTDPTNPGDHNVIQLTEQSLSRTTQSQEIALYSKKVANQTDQLFMRYPLNGSEFQISQYQIYNLDLGTQQTAFFSYLPGGIIVYFGLVRPNAFLFPINLQPAICSNIMGINLCPFGTSTLAAPLYQSNVNLTLENGKYTQVILSSSFELQIPPSQYYLIFGNI